MPKRIPQVPAGVEINGLKLRELRKQRGHTIEEFAVKCEISFGYLSQVERRTRPRVSPPVFVRICNALNIDEDARETMLDPSARRRLKAAA